MNNKNTKHSLTTGLIQSCEGDVSKQSPVPPLKSPPLGFLLFLNWIAHFYYWTEFILVEVPAEDIFNNHVLQNKVFPCKALCHSRTFSLKVWLLLAEWTDLNHCREMICSFVSLVKSNFCLKLWLKYVHLSWFTKYSERTAYPIITTHKFHTFQLWAAKTLFVFFL